MEKVTIYSQGFCGIKKVEGKLFSILHTPDGRVFSIEFIKKGCRKTSSINTYYSSFILVVRGWDQPDPPSAWEAPEVGATAGVTVQRAKYSSCSPAGRAEFEAAVKCPREAVIVET